MSTLLTLPFGDDAYDDDLDAAVPTVEEFVAASLTKARRSLKQRWVDAVAMNPRPLTLRQTAEVAVRAVRDYDAQYGRLVHLSPVVDCGCGARWQRGCTCAQDASQGSAETIARAVNEAIEKHRRHR